MKVYKFYNCEKRMRLEISNSIVNRNLEKSCKYITIYYYSISKEKF